MPYLLEFLGIILICATSLITHHNPVLVSLSVLSALYIGNGRVDSYFSPIIVGIEYGMGRMTALNAMKHLAVQAAAVLAVVLAFKF